MMSDIDNKIDSIVESLQEIKEVQIEQKASLDHHIYRTELAEERIKHIEELWERLKSHFDRLDGAIRLLAAVAVISGAVWTILQIVNHLKG
jgi:hypothetical protein